MAAKVKIRWTEEGQPRLILTTLDGRILDELICIKGVDLDWTVGDSLKDIEIEKALERVGATPQFESMENI